METLIQALFLAVFMLVSCMVFVFSVCIDALLVLGGDI